eukprot:gene41665-65789_t
MGATFGGVSGAMFAGFQGFISPESFSLMESVMIVAMVVLGGLGYLPGVILGAILLSALPEVLRYVAGPLQEMTGGRLDASIMRQLLVALAIFALISVAGVTLLRSGTDTQIAVKKRLGEMALSHRLANALEADLAQAIARPVRDQSGQPVPAFTQGDANVPGGIFGLVRAG